jgi:hypothetical protein
MANYSCPMHPDVQSDRPINCPKCGAQLVSRETQSQRGDKDKKEIPKRDR